MGAVAGQREQRDVLAFWCLAAFVVAMFTAPGEWIPWARPLRLALATSAAAAVLVVVRRLARREPFFLDGARGGALLCLWGLAYASARWSLAPDASRATAMDLLKLVAIYLTVVNVVTTGRRLRVLCGAIVLASIATSIGVINWYLRGEDLVEGFRARWVGVYADPNHMAMDLGIVVPLAIAFFARRQTPWLMRALALVAGGLAVTAIVFSHSRGGFVGLSAAVLVWAGREHGRRIQALAVALVLGLGLAVFAPSSFWRRNETLATFSEDASAMGRVHAWHVASRISLDRPLLGVGAGAFRYAWPLYAPPDARRAYVAHNVYLDVLGELGFVGLGLFLVFSGGAAGAAFAASRHREHGWLARGLAAAAVGYVVCDLFSGYLLSSHFYLLFGLAAVSESLGRAGARAPVLAGEVVADAA